LEKPLPPPLPLQVFFYRENVMTPPPPLFFADEEGFAPIGNFKRKPTPFFFLLRLIGEDILTGYDPGN